ncbi:MAG TPA: hypothetical protein VER36_08300 [Flavisolibacter sp.]|nr:hypothetical protein [Flavisolibacter sp.]
MVSTVTNYRSPIRLVKHASEETEVHSSQAISRARKRLMAEIMLIGDEIVIDDVSYSRNDASSLLDNITEQSWKAHCTIYAHKGLLDFLEKEEFNNEELKKADAYLYNSTFVQAVSPYFAHSFNAVSGRLIRQESFEELLQLLNYQGYILPEHSDEAYQKVRGYLDELHYTLRNLSWEKFIADESILHFIFSDEWKRFLNKLPSSFTGLRDELVEQMTGVVLRFQHKATWHYLHQVLVQLKAIETNDYNRSEVVRIDEIIYENSRIEGGKKRRTNDSEVSTGRVVWWAIWIILLIVRVSTCNNKSGSNSYRFDSDDFNKIVETVKTNKADEWRNEPVLLNFLDSLSHKRSLSLVSSQTEMRTGAQPFSSFANDFPKSGSDTVHITNNTGHNCVALLVNGPSLSGSVYEGALPNIAAVYIRQGGTYTFHTTPGTGKLYFIFGERWGQLKKQAELTVFSERGLSDGEGRKHLLFVYEFFSNKKSVAQTYLQKAVYLEDASANRNDSQFSYLNNPYDARPDESTEIILKENDSSFAVEAKGSLLVKEDRVGTVKTWINVSR